jgi:hypothetical protein
MKGEVKMSYIKEVYGKLQSDIFEIWMYRKEVETLEAILVQGEAIEFASAGSLEGVLGLWVVTNERLLYVYKSEEGIAVKGVQYEQIKNVMKDEYTSQNHMGSLTIHFKDGDQTTINDIKETSLERLYTEVKNKIQEEVVYNVREELEFYMEEGEEVCGNFTSFYKGSMQYAFITKNKFIMFSYGQGMSEIKMGKLSDIYLLETHRQSGEHTWNIHLYPHLCTIKMAEETSEASLFKSMLIENIKDNKNAVEVKQDVIESVIEDVLEDVIEEIKDENNEYTDFVSSLTDIEKQFISLFKQEHQINHHFLFARSHGLMWSSFIDGINEKSIEHLGELLFSEGDGSCSLEEEFADIVLYI